MRIEVYKASDLTNEQKMHHFEVKGSDLRRLGYTVDESELNKKFYLDSKNAKIYRSELSKYEMYNRRETIDPSTGFEIGSEEYYNSKYPKK